MKSSIAAALQTSVTLLDEAWLLALPRVRALVRRSAALTVAAAKTRLPKAGLQLSVALADDALVRHLNRQHRGIDRPTNVLSYPADAPARRGEARLLGDVVLALGTVRREARAQSKTLAHHVMHLTAHGTLHLLGYDHMVDAEAQAMEALEIEIMAALGVPDPYAG